MRKLSIFVLSFLVSQVVNAGGPISKNTIDSIAFQSGGFFMYADGWGNPNNCTQSKAIVLKSDDPNYDKAYSLLLAAYMSGKQISGFSDGCVSHDGQTYNSIRGFKYLVVTE